MRVVGQIAIAPVGPDHVDGAQHAAGMIPMPVREHQRLDAGQIDAELPGVAFECVLLRAGVEEKRVGLAAALRRYQAGQPVVGATDAFAGKDPHAFAVQVREFRFDVLGHAREAVGRVVDQDVNFQSVDRFERGHDFTSSRL